MANSKKKIPLKEGLFTMPSLPDEQPYLIAGKCRSCKEVFFPKQSICPNCTAVDIELVKLSRKGRLFTYTVVMQRPPIYYKADVPYALGLVELPEGLMIKSLITGSDFSTLKVGMKMELVIDKLHEDDQGNDVMTYKFKPV